MKRIFLLLAICFTAGNLFASDYECRKSIYAFWECISYRKVKVQKLITKDFVILSQGRKKKIKKTSGVKTIADFQDTQLIISSVKKEDYATAVDATNRIMQRNGYNIRQKSFASLSAYAKEQTKTYFKNAWLNFPDKLSIRKNKSMKIAKLKITGSRAVATVTFRDSINREQSNQITLQKIKGIWLVSEFSSVPITPEKDKKKLPAAKRKRTRSR